MHRKRNISFQLTPAGGPFDDPALLVTPNNWRESLLLDCGTLHTVGNKALMRVKWVFLTHLHIDHLIGFDHLLRIRLFSELPLFVFGPPGTTVAIGHRLQGYAWNLTSGSPFKIFVTDLHPDGSPTTLFACNEQFVGQPAQHDVRPGSSVEVDKTLSVSWHPVDHGVPCLCYRIEQSLPPKFSLETSKRLGLTPGPWMKALQNGEPVTVEVEGVERDTQWLSEHLLSDRAAQVLGYLTDTRLTPTLSEELIKFYNGADLLACESAYLDGELELAQQNLHMTTTQVGELAAKSKVGALLIFHLSRRHTAAGPKQHLKEVRSVFSNSELLSRCSSGTQP